MSNAFARLMLAEDPEAAMREDMAQAIRATRPPPDAPDRPFGLLLVGYAGAGNIGADIRIHETARQLRAIFGDGIRLGMMSRGGTTAPVSDVRVEVSDDYFPEDLPNRIARYDGVLVCEGSLFKSNFSNTLTTMLAGALGVASAQGKPAVAYGVEAGAMDADLTAFVREFCGDSTIFCRSAGSLATVRDQIALPALPGADTAWTFQAASAARARAILGDAGWNGSDPVLALCPIHPFCWPVKPDLLRAITGDTQGGDHYGSIFFHTVTDAGEAQFARYIDAFASAARDCLSATGAFPVVIGMEPLDARACAQQSAALPSAPPILTSDTVSAAEMVAVLHQATLVVSSRFHAAVTAMAGGIPAIGVTMDERLHNLMADLGRPDLCLDTGAPDLSARLKQAMTDVIEDPATATAGLPEFVGAQLRGQARMGRDLADVLTRAHPGLNRPAPGAPLSAYLPALSPEQKCWFDAALESHTEARSENVAV